MSNNREDNSWQIDRKVNLSIIITLITQVFLGGFWAAKTSSEIEYLKKSIVKIEKNIDNIMPTRYTQEEADVMNRMFERRLAALEMWKEDHQKKSMR